MCVVHVEYDTMKVVGGYSATKDYLGLRMTLFCTGELCPDDFLVLCKQGHKITGHVPRKAEFTTLLIRCCTHSMWQLQFSSCSSQHHLQNTACSCSSTSHIQIAHIGSTLHKTFGSLHEIELESVEFVELYLKPGVSRLSAGTFRGTGFYLITSTRKRYRDLFL